ncbi:MAG TPA: hypothetical protein ENK80_01965, partial [Rhodobacterales bacterium]|nr:hypothetical protein [Rhodobacterales bacterium]
MTRFIAPLLAAAFTALPLFPAMAGNEARVDVLPGWQTETGTHMAGLRIHLAPGWKTYWRAPGEAGLPPVFDWSASANVDAVTVHWPVPDIFDTSGATTLGYHDEIILPVEIEPNDAQGDIQLDGALAMGICKDICMPMQVTVSATLPHDLTNADPRITLAL